MEHKLACLRHPAAPLPRATSGARRSLARTPCRSKRLIVRADQAGGGDGGQPPPAGGDDSGPSAISLVRRLPGPGYTFVLAGFLKILTIGAVATTAPVDAARTAFGTASQYMMVPVGLALCWIAKKVTDAGLQEDRRFMTFLIGGLVLLYFGLVKLLYKYEPGVEYARRPRARYSHPMAQLRAAAGDRDLMARDGGVDSRRYQRRTLGAEGEAAAVMGVQHDDVAYYEGRYPSELRRGGAGVDGEAGAVGAAEGSSEVAGGADAAARRGRMVNRRSFLSSND